MIILFVCLSLYLRFFSKKSSIWSDILYNHQFYHADFRWKASVLSENISTSLFNYIQLVFVCTSFYLSIFPSKSSILSIILCSPQIYHTYITWKSSLLYKNISISFFNYILIVFICLSMSENEVETFSIKIEDFPLTCVW